MPEPAYTECSFEELSGWPEEDHAAVLASYLGSAAHIALPGWPLIPASAPASAAPRQWIESMFRPLRVTPAGGAHLTGYFEPEFEGRRERTPGYKIPLLALPSTGNEGLINKNRAEILASSDSFHALAWLADPLDAFFLQVQGSGRIRTPEGVLRLGYAGTNGFPYRSIGRHLVETGEIAEDAISPEEIRQWADRNPKRLPALLELNESFVFFRLLDGLDPETGPLGTQGVPLVAGRSCAVDPEHIPLGAVLWVDRPGEASRAYVAQDTGSAIRGPGRADLYFGTGPEAGKKAGALNSSGRLTVFWPRALPAPGGRK